MTAPAERHWYSLPRWTAALRSLAAGVATVVILAILFVVLGDVIVEDKRVALDRSVDGEVHELASHNLTTAMRWVTDLGAAPITVIVFLGMIGWLLWRHRKRDAVLVTISWFGAQLLDFSLKDVYHRNRPELFSPFVHTTGYSFPSGHTTTALVTYGLLAYLVVHLLHGWVRVVPVLVAIALVVAVAFSRVYLGAHYFTDVLGSVLMGGAWLRASLLAWTHLDRPREVVGDG